MAIAVAAIAAAPSSAGAASIQQQQAAFLAWRSAWNASSKDCATAFSQLMRFNLSTRRVAITSLAPKAEATERLAASCLHGAQKAPAASPAVRRLKSESVEYASALTKVLTQLAAAYKAGNALKAVNAGGKANNAKLGKLSIQLPLDISNLAAKLKLGVAG